MNFDGFNCRTTIDNNIDVSIEVKIYLETSFRLKSLIKEGMHSDSQKRLRQLYVDNT